VAFGGWVIRYLAGFTATYLLCCVNFVQIPTSLLAYLDRSHDDKNGLNAKAGKNVIFAFCQPRALAADTNLPK